MLASIPFSTFLDFFFFIENLERILTSTLEEVYCIHMLQPEMRRHATTTTLRRKKTFNQTNSIIVALPDLINDNIC